MAFTLKRAIFAKIILAKIIMHRSSKESTQGLSYGVMVAQQVLVLFVLVRIRVGQQKSQLVKADFFVVLQATLLLCRENLLPLLLLFGSEVLHQFHLGNHNLIVVGERCIESLYLC